ncbi:MAG: hypothetical protein VKJ64_02690 [Leptolyngbyaceae bacterium]|nr:hypothetical protein [Leptolyngbyaceae bacterium]
MAYMDGLLRNGSNRQAHHQDVNFSLNSESLALGLRLMAPERYNISQQLRGARQGLGGAIAYA